ncbi:hypothetical protein FXO37_02537 [Capsicum annuum]|nr:hypothetical protein FXO37_02537 [Capsicum annuum]
MAMRAYVASSVHVLAKMKRRRLCEKDIRDEVKAFVDSKTATNPKNQRYMPSYNIVDDDDDMNELEEMMFPSKYQKMSSSGGSVSSSAYVTKGLPFNCVNYDSFTNFIEAVGQHGPGMEPPTYHEVRVSQLNKEVKKVDELVEKHKVQWQKYGSIFLGSVDASNESTTSTKMYNLFEKTIEDIGPKNIVQVVMDNASENVKVGDFMRVFKKATKVVSYISQRPLLLNLMRKFTKEKNLVKLAKTRFAMTFLTLEAMYKQMKNLRTLIISNEWSTSKFAKEVLGKEVSAILYFAYFWNDVVKVVKVYGPLVSFLRLVDGEKDPQWAICLKQ